MHVCYNVLQANGEDRDSGQMIVPGGKQKCPPGLEEREAGSFRSLTWLCLPYMMPGTQHGGVRRWTGVGYGDQYLHFLPLAVVRVPFQE